ncbi:hypothetical protein HK097_007246 [Rhizophlyctis rosea]|uniref:Uncharacterized protein n=1 Tax=Rhizophlyctis rosea TaxID=64517 RepID=A0AAD5SBV7_9FUNG|nr:hypothetical protein HK097_007246 [Rhizophlyctis rosea]
MEDDCGDEYDDDRYTAFVKNTDANRFVKDPYQRGNARDNVCDEGSEVDSEEGVEDEGK